MKDLAGSSSLDAGGGSCGPGDDAFCASNWVWLIGAVLVFYQSDFLDAVLISPITTGGTVRLNFPFYVAGMLLLALNAAIFYYLVVHLSWNRGVGSDDWDAYVPRAVPTATASFVGAAVCLSIGLWPRWGVLTVPILSTVFMGLIVVVAMLSRLYKMRRFGRAEEADKKRT